MKRPMAMNDRRQVALAAVSGIGQAVAFVVLLWLTHESVESRDYADASVTALVFLAFVIEWAGDDR